MKAFTLVLAGVVLALTLSSVYDNNLMNEANDFHTAKTGWCVGECK